MDYPTLADIEWDEMIYRLDQGEDPETIAQELAHDAERFYDLCFEIQRIKEEHCEGN